MPRVCFEEKPVINTFYDDVEVCKRGGKKKKAKKTKPYISNVNKVIVNLTQGNRRRMTAPKQQFANQPKALQSITYSNPVAPSHFDNRPASTHNEPMKIAKDTIEEKVPRSIPTFASLENPFGLCPADSKAQRATPSRTPVGGVLSSAPITAIAQQTLAKSRELLQRMRDRPSYFPPAGRDNIPPPRQAEQDIARPSNFIPLVAAQPETREVVQQRMQDQPIRGLVRRRLDESSGSNERMSAYQKQVAEHRARREASDPIPVSSNRSTYYNPGLTPRSAFPMRSISDSDEKEAPSKKRGGSVF